MQMGRLAQAALVFLNRGRRAVCLGRLLTPLTISKMAWQLEPNSGPFPGPWEGKDAVSWIWEITPGTMAVWRERYRRETLKRCPTTGTAMRVLVALPPNYDSCARRHDRLGAAMGRDFVAKRMDVEEKSFWLECSMDLT